MKLFRFFIPVIVLIYLQSSNAISGGVLSGFLILSDSVLAPGVVYRNVLIGKGRYKHSVHFIEADLVNPFVSAVVLKAFNQVNELEKMHSMIRKYDSANPGNKLLGAVNANFWRAYSNRPIGPTIIDGEVLEMITHKRWSSAFFNKISFMYIDTFFLEGTIGMETGATLNIKRVNRRHDSLGVVLYNRFGGDTIPYVHNNILMKAFAAALQDTVFDDLTEAELDTAILMETIRTEQLELSYEYSQMKILLKYIDDPAINKDIKCRVIGIKDSGSVAVPSKGCVISCGDDFNFMRLPITGDTLIIRFSTNLYDSVEFYNSVAGTPRLVRDGKAKNEAREEGSKGWRFINSALARTAVGTNKSMTKIYLVAVETGSKWKRTRGASLAQLANIMKQIGCYNAMNLDGGGSTIMVIDNNNSLRYNTLSSRHISVGLGIVLKDITEKTNKP
jgi:hypothetical protein